MGIKGSSTTPGHPRGRAGPGENLLGEIGKGHKIAFNILNVGRFKLGAAVLGGAKYVAGRRGATYANERKQFGQADRPTSAPSARSWPTRAATFASESLVYRMAGLIDDRLATLQKGAPDYYEAYQAAIEEYCHRVRHLEGLLQRVLALRGGRGGPDLRRVRLRARTTRSERAYRDERINRIFEGTNEINRLLIPGIILRKRAMKGELPLQDEVMKAVGRLSAPAADPPAVAFGAEKQLLRNLKDAFLVLAGLAVQRYMAKINEEQEVLIALADLAIGVFALESWHPAGGEKIAASGNAMAGDPTSEAATKVFAFQSQEDCTTAARRAAFYIGEGAMLKTLLTGIRRSGRYEAVGAPGSEAQARRRDAREGAVPDLLRPWGSGPPQGPLPSPKTFPFGTARFGSAGFDGRCDRKDRCPRIDTPLRDVSFALPGSLRLRVFPHPPSLAPSESTPPAGEVSFSGRPLRMLPHARNRRTRCAASQFAVSSSLPTPLAAAPNTSHQDTSQPRHKPQRHRPQRELLGGRSVRKSDRCQSRRFRGESPFRGGHSSIHR